MAYSTCDTQKIRVLGSVREFESVQELLDSGIASKREVELTGVNYRVWWRNLTVAFPDKCHASSAMVEVHGKDVFVGHPGRYFAFETESFKEALQLAARINEAWLNSKESESQFLANFSFPYRKIRANRPTGTAKK